MSYIVILMSFQTIYSINYDVIVACLYTVITTLKLLLEISVLLFDISYTKMKERQWRTITWFIITSAIYK